jgi:hypothetical protein
VKKIALAHPEPEQYSKISVVIITKACKADFFKKNFIAIHTMVSTDKNHSKLRKLAVILLTFAFAGILLTSCKSREKCAAYGEHRKFQQEQGY